MAKKLTSEKARKILHDKSVHGKPLTEKQRKFFGAIAGGAEPYKAQIGTMLTALPSNMMDRLSDALGFPQKAVTKLVTGKYQTPSEAMNIQSPAGAIAADVLLDPLTFIGGGAGASKAAKAVKQSTKTGLLSRAHEYNPWAFKPQEGVMMYRGIGEEGMKDALESGLIRSKQNTGIVKEKNFTISKQFGNPYFSPSFETANRYGQGYIAEVPISAANWRRRYGNPNKTWSQIASREIPITEGRILKKDWLRGYKEVKPPKKKQDGGWLDKYDAPQAQNGIEGTMGGLTDIGFNYNGAWNGPSMQMGGSLPGAVGFMYARTQSPAPSNGPYAKKTKASAQDGKKLSYGQWKKQYNLKETPDYNLKRAWELGYTPDKTGHLPTVDNQTGQFLKAKGHPTLQLELDWYNSAEAADFRSKNAIDSSGKFFKYVPKGQNGQEMKYYQEGLDFKPKTISQDGSRTPIYVSDPNDPRLKTYQDSLYSYNVGQRMAGILQNDKNLIKVSPKSIIYKNLQAALKASPSGLLDNSSYDSGGYRNYEKLGSIMKEYQSKGNKGILPIRYQPYWPNPDNTVMDLVTLRGFRDAIGLTKEPRPGSANLPEWKKPEQQVILDPSKAPKKQTSKTIGPFPIIETPRRGKYVPIEKEEIDLGYNLPTPKPFIALKTPEQTPTKYTFTYPTGKYNEQKTMYFPSKAALKSFVGSIRDASYQEGADYASATGTLQDGGDIPVDPMGYWNPENVGNPVIIPSNVITMEGVDQPLIGVSDTGDVQYMEPGEDYEFDGEYVTEYPVAKGGVSVNNADAQPLKKLDQLLNFTNYNKPTKGGWLDKYN